MEITKYEHSCLDIEIDGRHLVIDPGIYSVSYKPGSSVDVVFITHVHGDHFDPNCLKLIRAQNPQVKIYGSKQVADEHAALGIQTVTAGQELSAGVFKLAFFGGKHELYEGFDNVGVLVGDTLYHPGDSYAQPGRPVKVLAAPASAPWLRVSEASEFIKQCAPGQVFPIHNALLSEIGESIHYRILSEAAETAGAKWQVLKTGDSLSV